VLASLSIVFKLFKKPFIFVGLLYFMALLLFVVVVGLKDAYKSSLESEFATKQPHINIHFIDNNVLLNNELLEEKILSIKSLSSMIDVVSPFVSGGHFYSSLGFKEGGNAQYSGEIKIIGVGDKYFVHDFFSSFYIARQPFQVPYTPLEFIQSFRANERIMVYNKALFNSYFPVIAGVEHFTFDDKKSHYKGRLASVFTDYDKEPILYTTLNFANTLLQNNPNKVDGFFVNAKELSQIESLVDILKVKLPSDTYIISSWLQERQQQFVMFFLFESLSLIILGVVLFLSGLFILLLLYHAIVKKSYHLSVLLTLGFGLKLPIFLVFVTIMTFVSLVTIYIDTVYLPQIITYLALPFDSSMLYNSYFYILLLDSLFVLCSYLLIHSAYNIKAKSVF